MRKTLIIYTVRLILLILVALSINIDAQALQKVQIAFQSNRDGDYEIYIMDIDGNSLRRSTNNSFYSYACPRMKISGLYELMGSR